MDTVKKVTPDNKISIVDPAKRRRLAYPISTFTYVILPTKSDNAAALRKFVFWAHDGRRQEVRPALRFVQMPPKVLERLREDAQEGPELARSLDGQVPGTWSRDLCRLEHRLRPASRSARRRARPPGS